MSPLKPEWFAENFIQVHTALLRALDGDAVGAIVVGAIRFRMRYFGEEIDGQRWWRGSFADIEETTGLGVDRIQRAVGRLRDSFLVTEKHHIGGAWDQTLSYRLVMEDEPPHDAPARTHDAPARTHDAPARTHDAPARTPVRASAESSSRASAESSSVEEVEEAPTTPPTSEANAGLLVKEWIDTLPSRPPGRVVGQVAREVRQMLDEGVPADDVRRGIVRWQERGQHPSVLPSLVHQVQTQAAQPARPAATRTAYSPPIHPPFTGAPREW